MSGSEPIDFGAPSAFGAHHFYVVIPESPRQAVEIHEDFGFEGEEAQRETTECRVILARELWTKIRDDARRDFNARLKRKKLGAGGWQSGKVKLDRFLGKELCVLAWASEHATVNEIPIITRKWLALRPEERWWLYSKTAAEAGAANQTLRGWRKGLYCSLSDGESIKVAPKVKPRSKPKKPDSQDLFDFIEKGDI
ncbi:MAG: DUF3780 domain-containing protein [Opitutales bacterium]|nr:DUF3780 domain-containing protein [Opitutales bacterium]